MRQKPDRLLAEIADLHAKLEAAIEKAVDEQAEGAPGIPRGVLRGCVTRNEPCLCRAVRTLLGAPEVQ